MLISLLLTIAPAFALILFSSFEARERAMAESRQEAASRIIDMRSRVQDILKQYHSMLKNIASMPEISAQRPADKCTELLGATLRLNPQFVNIIVADAAGIVRCSAVASRYQVNVADRDYFKNALRFRDFVVGNYQVSRISGKNSLVMAHPILDGTGKVSAVVAIGLDLDWLNGILGRTDLPTGSILSLLDGNGNLIAGHHNEQGLLGRPVPEWTQLVAGGRGGEISEAKWSNGEDRLTALLPLFPENSGSNLYLRIGVPTHAAYSEINRIENRDLLLMGIAAFLALSIGWIAGDRLLLRRIGELSRAARRLAEGDLDARANLPPDASELGQLSGVFNKMGETLKLRDVSIKQADADLRQANRALAVLSAVNHSLVRAMNEQTLLDEVCQEIVRDGNYPLAWVGFAEKGENHSIRVMAMAGENLAYIDGLNLSLSDQTKITNPAGNAILSGKTTILRNLLSDPRFIEWRPELIKHRFAAMIALPIIINGKVIGALQICAPEPEAFDTEEVKLLQELADDLGYGISSLRHAAEHERVERELAYQNNYDTLTGLANRNLFHDRLSQVLLQASRSGTLVAVVMLDLDRFKTINESLGHGTGDSMLSHVGQCLTSSLRKGDTVARLSADEFAVIMNDVAKEEDVAPVARKLLAAVMQPLNLGGREIYTSTSMGISLYPKDGKNGESLIKNASAALYRAKSVGGGSFRFYAPEMNERTSARFIMEADLRGALERDELMMYFQPKVSLVSGRVTGAEALVRWRHPEIGIVPPGDFIPLAEESGLIQPMGKWVVENVCAQLRTWLDAGLPVPPVAINLSPHQFRQENLAALIQHSLRSNTLDARYIDLEITESALMDDVESAVATMHELRAVGVKLSLDDFGTGFSSLSYLKRFPIDQLKIDRAFVRDLTSDPDDCEICTAVIGLAHNLNLTVVAEGVESEGQMNFLRRQGCDEMQGHYFSMALPAAEFAKLLAEPRSMWLSELLPEEQHLMAVRAANDQGGSARNSRSDLGLLGRL